MITVRFYLIKESIKDEVENKYKELYEKHDKKYT